MEFFRIINSTTEDKNIKKILDINHLESMSSQLFLLEPLHDHMAKIGSLWGEFTLTRQEIKGGLRFSLLECPNLPIYSFPNYHPTPG